MIDNKEIEGIIKATSVSDDLTSFGPNSVWDDIYWLDFYKEGRFDGSFDVYRIPNELIYEHKVNKGQTMKEQQEQMRRPRMRIRAEIITPNNLKPIKTCKL
ncbi:MAG TPA: Bsp6I family type II restriction endonuclease [Candidatus Pacearchaeota archaeon]|nr:Bsp6I family type II restriction endonuclease [Candidatus Pacearchaeota archaeon]